MLLLHKYNLGKAESPKMGGHISEDVGSTSVCQMHAVALWLSARRPCCFLPAPLRSATSSLKMTLSCHHINHCTLQLPSSLLSFLLLSFLSMQSTPQQSLGPSQQVGTMKVTPMVPAVRQQYSRDQPLKL